MDKITLINIKTDQECKFDTRAQAEEFMEGVADPESWRVKGWINRAAGQDQGDQQPGVIQAAADIATDEARQIASQSADGAASGSTSTGTSA